MHVARTGIWLSLTPDKDSTADREFAESVGAVYVDKAREYRLRYTEPLLRKVADYTLDNGGSLDTTCSALITFNTDQWSEKLVETVVSRTKRPQMHHQKQGVTFLLEYKRAMLGFDMGTGKTKTAVDTAQYLFDTGQADICLVVTDASVVDTWVETLIPEDSDSPAISLTGSRTTRITRLRWGLANGYKFFVINYDGVPVIDDELAACLSSRTILILDESQRVKTHTTRRFKTIWKLHERFDFEYIFLLSGTPITQSPEDIFGQYAFVNPNIFGHPRNGWWGFRATYVQTSAFDKHIIIGYRNMRKFLEKFHSRCFRVKTSDVLDLPPKQYIPIKFELPDKLAKVYKEFTRSHGFVRVPGHPKQGDRDELFVAMHPFTMLSKARQIANNFLYMAQTDDDDKETIEIVQLFEECPNPKLDFIFQLLEDTDQPVILWFHHRAMKAVLERALLAHKISFVTVDGSVPIPHRLPLLTRFTSGKVRVLAAQQSTIRTGIKLVCSRLNIYVENDFKVETRQQTEKRTHRLGMDEGIESVLYYDLIYAKTAEQTVYDRLMDGVELSSALVDMDNIELLLTGAWDVK